MSTLASAPRLPRLLRVGSVTPARVVHSEWTKLRSLRSTRYSLIGAVVLMVGIALIACAATVNNWASMSPLDRATFDPLTQSLRGIDGAVLAIGVLGVLWITGEYTTGSIRSTFAAVPRRLPVLWAKAGVLGAVTLVLSIPAALGAFFAGQAILGQKGISIAFTHPGVPRAVIGAALFLTVLALFSLGLGAVIRSTAGGIFAVVALVYVVPGLIHTLPTNWENAIWPYLPTNAGEAITSIHPDPNALAPWTGLGLFAGYAAALLAVAAVLLRRRDV